MKKIFMITLATMLIFSSFCSSTYALESGVESFSIDAIQANQKHSYILVNITVPEVQENCNLLVGFFTNGSLTRLTPVDISESRTFTSMKINVYKLVKDPEGNYQADQTPDEIKIFTWDKNSLAPKALCDNVLTPEVIKAANKEVVDSLNIVPQATLYVRENCLDPEEDYINGEADSWDTHLFEIMDYIDFCARQCVLNAENHLITSLYAREQYKDELSEMRKLFNNAPSKQKSKLYDLVNPTVLPETYYNALANAMKFLDFTLTEI